MNLNNIFDEGKNSGDIDINKFATGGMDLDGGFQNIDGLGVEVPPVVAQESNNIPVFLAAIGKGKSYKAVIATAKKAGIKLSANEKRLFSSMDNVLGNYVVSCKYAPKARGQYHAFVKYAIDCDCVNDDCAEAVHCDDGSMDGFFNPTFVESAKEHICAKTGLPVLADIKDMTTDDKQELFAKVVSLYPQAINLNEEFLNKNGLDAVKYLFDNLEQKEFETPTVVNPKDYYIEKSDMPFDISDEVAEVGFDNNYNQSVDNIPTPAPVVEPAPAPVIKDFSNLPFVVAEPEKVNPLNVESPGAAPFVIKDNQAPLNTDGQYNTDEAVLKIDPEKELLEMVDEYNRSLNDLPKTEILQNVCENMNVKNIHDISIEYENTDFLVPVSEEIIVTLDGFNVDLGSDLDVEMTPVDNIDEITIKQAKKQQVFDIKQGSMDF